MHDINFRKVISTNEEDMIFRNQDHHVRMSSDAHSRNDVANAVIARKDNETRKLILSYVPNGEVALDMGVGAGGSYLALSHKFTKIYGIDVVDTHFDVLTQYDSLTKGSIETLTFDDEMFDCVFSAHVMEHTYDIQKTLSNILRVLKPNGHVVAITPHYFPDPEIAHITQLGMNEWVKEYTNAGFNVIYSYPNYANCEECHIVAQKR